MICHAALLHSWFSAAVLFCTAGFQVHTLHALLAMKGLLAQCTAYPPTGNQFPSPISKTHLFLDTSSPKKHTQQEQHTCSLQFQFCITPYGRRSRHITTIGKALQPRNPQDIIIIIIIKTYIDKQNTRLGGGTYLWRNNSVPQSGYLLDTWGMQNGRHGAVRKVQRLGQPCLR